ncbi:peroxidase-like isoform X2 [Amphibalanus amphitrite]|uniref:peroxidase-like isoform X2 n=1 Tax=Amphibalanus amphitrite TaxID=1232801 RepID=UPI001C917A05|nr:peroxidase-like isoform X2 [Amphibalanus amphitrite]
MKHLLLYTIAFTSLAWSVAQLCYDAAGNSFAGNDVAYFLDQRFNCTIMICRNGTPQVLKQLCERELNETMIQGMKPTKTTTMPTGSCVPLHECPEAVDQALIFCSLPSGDQGVVCFADNDITDFIPHEYPDLQEETLQIIARSALPRAAKQILTSLPEETADGRSETEAALEEAVQSASRATREAVVQAADDYVDKMANSTDQLLATGQLPPPTTTTHVFNLNFRHDPKVQRIALEAVRDLSTSTFFLSTRPQSPETTTESSTRATTRPASQPTSPPSSSPSKSASYPPRSTSGQSGSTAQGYSSSRTGGAAGTEEDSTPADGDEETTVVRFPRVNQTCTALEPPPCDHTAIYRSADGSCNNLRQPLWGRRRTPFRRIFQNTYSDGIFSPTSSPTLPNARLLSETLMDYESVAAQQRTLAVMTWGQFMDHDLAHTPIFQLDDGHGIECCSKRNSPPPETPVHLQCLPITVRQADAFYGPHQERCMNFVRSVPSTRPACGLGPANQLNDLTHWIDCSQVYGSDSSEQRRLRTFSGGLLRTSPGDLLPREVPVVTEDGQGETTSCRGNVCFVAGDSRVNENPMLTMYHTLFVREHNRIARQLQHSQQYSRNFTSPATDEDLFQRARRIVIAEWQHITYNEWLPALLGYSYAESVGLSKTYGDHSFEYLDFLHPGISNSFATAGFRLHSLIQDMLHFVSASGNTTTTVPLHETFFEPSVLLSSIGQTPLTATIGASTSSSGTSSTSGTALDGTDSSFGTSDDGNASNSSSGSGGTHSSDGTSGGVNPNDVRGEIESAASLQIARLARGITKQSPRLQDRHFSGQIRGQLFATECVGLDLVTLNIQRGRDHGLAKYPTVLRWCTGVAITRWSDLVIVMTSENVARLKKVYSDWTEIDMYVGINMERLVPGAMLGPTARCLITEQFVRLRFGDRFFYDLGGQPGSFTKAQLTQLRRASWSRLLCDTVGADFSAIQPLAFFQPNNVFNPVTDCSLLPGMDLSVF